MEQKTEHSNSYCIRILFPFLLLLIAGCNSYLLDDAQYDLRNSFADGDYSQSEQLLKSFDERDLYKGKDAVLWNLENGMIYRFAGKYDSSTTFLHQAELDIENNYTKSISVGFESLIANDNKLAYDGEPYEDIYLNAFKALNFVHQKDWEGALVETRRMSFKMEQLDIKIKGLADAFSKADSSGRGEWESNKVNIQNSAFAHYLSTVLYAKTGNPDNARIEFEKIGVAFRDQAALGNYEPFDTKELEYLKNPGTYNVLLTSFTGQSPIKYQNDVRLFLDKSYLKFSFPSIELYQTRVHNVRAVINGKRDLNLHLIEEMDLVSKEIYQAKQPIIYTRAFLRSLFKAGGTSLISDAIEEESTEAGFVAKVLSLLYKEASEKADLRGWQTMPGQAWMHAINLPIGTNTVTLEYLSSTGQVLYAEEYEVDITENTDLELIESIFSK
ncbi:MAG: hypothetical protein ED557_00255 [Balneola sp.]|nr:MAG: hypothetical protein ED557_00255 [Balneola sp.]